MNKKEIRTVLADDQAVLRDGLRHILESNSESELKGIHATQRICEMQCSTQVVILSMHATTEHIYQALHAGARGYKGIGRKRGRGGRDRRVLGATLSQSTDRRKCH